MSYIYLKLKNLTLCSQEPLAKKAGITYSTLIKTESGGIGNPKIETIIKFANALGISIDELVDRKNIKK